MGLITRPALALEPAELGTQHLEMLERWDNDEISKTYFGILADWAPTRNKSPTTTAG